MHALFQRLVSRLVMTMFVLKVVDHSQHPVRDVKRGTLACRAQSAFPENAIVSFFHSVVDESVLSDDVQLQSRLCWFSSQAA